MFKNILIFPLILICSEMAVFLSTDMYLPALPDIMRELSVSSSAIQLTLSSWFIGSMSVQLFVGPLSDRIGRRPVFMIGMVIFVLSTLVCATAHSIFVLTLARFFQGTTVCFIIVPGYASIHELYDQKNAIRILATMSSITVLAPALGPFVGGLITTLTSWRWIFMSLFMVGTVIMGWLIVRMPETLSVEKRQPLNLASALKHYTSIIGNWHFMHYLLTYGFIFCGFMSWLVCGPFLVTSEFHYKPLFFGMFQLAIFGFYMLSNRLVKSLLNKMQVNQLIEMGLGVTFAGSVFAIATALLYPDQLIGLVLGMMLFSFGFGLSSACLQRLIIDASDAPMGSRMAVLSTCLGLAGLLSTALVSLMYQGQVSSLAKILLATAVLACILYLSGRQFHATTADEIETPILMD